MKTEMLTQEDLWNAVFHGSPTLAAMALVILDSQLDGKITEFRKKIKEGKING